MEDAGDSRLEIVDGGLPSLVVGRLGVEADEFMRPTGVAFGRDGAIHVADAGLNRVQKLNPMDVPRRRGANRVGCRAYQGWTP